MAKSDSKAEDERREQATQSRMSKAHGGEVVESIAPEELESFNDDECKHERLVRDETETEWNAFVCTNPKCNEVVLFDKDK